MAQDLIKISPEALQLQLPNLNFGTLKRLYAELYQHMRNKGSKMSIDAVILLQRKLTKIQSELNRRSKLGSDFQVWEKKLQRDLRRG